MSDIDSDDESDPFMMFRGPPILNIRCMDEHPDDCAEVVMFSYSGSSKVRAEFVMDVGRYANHS